MIKICFHVLSDVGCSIETPLGMESGDIPDDNITASTYWRNRADHAPQNARLNNRGNRLLVTRNAKRRQILLNFSFHGTILAVFNSN